MASFSGALTLVEGVLTASALLAGSEIGQAQTDLGLVGVLERLLHAVLDRCATASLALPSPIMFSPILDQVIALGRGIGGGSALASLAASAAASAWQVPGGAWNGRRSAALAAIPFSSTAWASAGKLSCKATGPVGYNRPWPACCRSAARGGRYRASCGRTCPGALAQLEQVDPIFRLAGCGDQAAPVRSAGWRHRRLS